MRTRGVGSRRYAPVLRMLEQAMLKSKNEGVRMQAALRIADLLGRLDKAAERRENAEHRTSIKLAEARAREAEALAAVGQRQDQNQQDATRRRVKDIFDEVLKGRRASDDTKAA